MADFFCDISAVGNEYQAYAATPVWGSNATDKPLPMDGNGRAGPGHAAAVAIAEIKLNALPADGSTLIIAGATLTAKTTVAAKNQFAIGATVAATVTNIVALLNTFGTGTNACDAAVSTYVSQIALALPYWQFARVKPGTTDTVQIATRIAGADLNADNNSFALITHAGWTTAPTVVQFAGGADGPFGYFWNTAGPVFGKTGGTNAHVAYGIAGFASGGPDEPGTLDIIHVRTRRGGADLSLTHTSNLSTYYYFGTPNNASRVMLFDDGTIWAGDNGKFHVYTINSTGNGSSSVTFRGGQIRLIGRKDEGFHWRHTGTSSVSSLQLTSGSFSNVWVERAFFEEDPSAANVRSLNIARTILNSSSGIPSVVFNLVRWSHKGNGRPLTGENAAGGGGHLRFLRNRFEYPGAVNGLVAAPTYSTEHVIEFSRCEFVDVNGMADPVLTSPITGTPLPASRIIFDQCVGVAPFTVSGWGTATNASVVWRAPGEDNAHRVECAGFVSEWRPDIGIPTLNSLLLSGVPWAYKVLVREMSSALEIRRPLQLAAKYRLATAIANVDLELLVPSGTDFNTSQLGIDVEYTDSTGVVRRETSLTNMLETLLGTAASIADSTAAWTLNGLSGYVAKRLRLTTSYPVKSGTSVAVCLTVVGTLPGGSDKTIFVEPMPALSVA